MPRAVVLLLAWLAVACALGPASPVVALVDASGAVRCSAFAVPHQRLLTAAHCVPEAARHVAFTTSPPSWGVEYASVLARNAEQDWAVLEPTITLPELVIAEPELGPVQVQAARADWAVALGALLESYYAGNAIDGSDIRRWSASLDVEPGWSGSPVMQGGRAIGILQSCRGVNFPWKACYHPGFVVLFPASQVPL